MLLVALRANAIVPASDLCENATAIAAAPFSDQIDTTSATTSPGEPIPDCTAEDCGADCSRNSVWFRFTAPFTGAIIADTFDSDYDTVLSAYSGSCGNLVPAPNACNDDDPFDGAQSKVSFAAAAGTTYFLMVSALNGDGGTLVLHLSIVTSPDNDACSMPTVITAVPFSTSLSTLTATTEAIDPLQPCTYGGPDHRNTNSVWYSFTAPSNGDVSVNTVGSGYDTVLTVYTGNCANLTQVACNDDIAPPNNVASQLMFSVIADTTYLFEATHSFVVPSGNLLHFSLDFAAAPTPTATSTATATPTPRPSETPTATPTSRFTPEACPGSCAGTDATGAADVVRVVTIVTNCPCPTGAGGLAQGCPRVPGTDVQCLNADADADGCIRGAEFTDFPERIFECE